MFADGDVGPRMVDGHPVALREEEKQALVEAWNAEEVRRAAPPLYREARALAYRDELGKERGDYIKTLGDVLDVLIAQMEAMRKGTAVPATDEYAALASKIAEIKARHPRP